jgi:hypothetical protein
MKKCSSPMFSTELKVWFRGLFYHHWLYWSSAWELYRCDRCTRLFKREEVE